MPSVLLVTETKPKITKLNTSEQQHIIGINKYFNSVAYSLANKPTITVFKVFVSILPELNLI